jgi:hypothetical protein
LQSTNQSSRRAAGAANRRNQHISIENIFHIAYDITLSVTSNLLTHKTLRQRGSLPSCPPCLKGDLNVIATHAAAGDVVLMQETRTHSSRTCRRSIFLAKSPSRARSLGAGSYQFRSGWSADLSAVKHKAGYEHGHSFELDGATNSLVLACVVYSSQSHE